MLFKNAGTHKREKHFTWKATRPVVCHADTSGKWAVVQDGQFGALEKKQKITEACRGGKRTSPFRGPLQRNIKGQSWLTQFSATSVEARLKMKEEKKKNNNNICLEASTSMHNGHVKTTTSACAC